MYHERIKHIEVEYYFVHKKIQENILTGYVKTRKLDLFTRALNEIRVDYFCNKLGMINIYAPTLGVLQKYVYRPSS